MDRIFAPWRIDYIKADQPEEGCVLCNAAQADDDAEKLVLHRGVHAYVIMNKYPYTNGHLMVSPYAHLGEMTALSTEMWAEVMELTTLCVRALEMYGRPHGFNIGMNIGRVAGAGVEGHLHMHVVPRWNGDVNFMPVLADVRVINEHIGETFAALRRAFEELIAQDKKKGSE
ncbi:MAG: HIT domain-containing protein [Candidatus Lernaella stagnicola]|nr:HIT domain-containing protein [Candidatus Lernaella stagnicola]